MGSTDSRPEGDSVDRPPPDELKCMLDRLERGPPSVRPECGILRTPPCRIAVWREHLPAIVQLEVGPRQDTLHRVVCGVSCAGGSLLITVGA